jgi:hypothetical protein
MDYGEIKELLERRFKADGKILRPDDAAKAVKLGFEKILADANLRGMEARSADLPYLANSLIGVTVAADYHSARYVWRKATDGTLIGPLQPTTEDEAVGYIQTALHQSRFQRSHNHFWGVAERWYERQLKIVLLDPPSDNSVTLVVDYWKNLPFYATNTATDYISLNFPLLLIYASAWLWLSLFSPADAGEQYKTLYEAELKKAVANDVQMKQGGQYRVFRPPLAIGGRR